jgi:hypothetical protein
MLPWFQAMGENARIGALCFFQGISNSGNRSKARSS